MAEIHLRKIKQRFEQTYQDHVDLSDAQPIDRDSKYLTRALILCALELTCEASPDKGAQFVTDGPGDNGIDGVFFHPEERCIYLMQSKWSDRGSKTIEVGDVHKFIQGAKDILDKNKSAFKRSKRITALWPKIEYAVDEATRIHLVFVFNSDNPLSTEAQAVVDRYKAENNAPTEIVFSRVISQKDLYEQVTGTASPAINIDASLFSWGQVKEPHVSVYGQMYCGEVAAWYTRFGDRLFAPNIRSFLGDTEVNQRIQKTLEDNPQLFWYFNNGITATCDSLEKKPGGGLEFGNFIFHNLRIVNGAQTVGAIHSTFQDKADQINAETAKVLVKVISLEQADEKLGNEITINTNTQNRVSARDFLSLEKLQLRLKADLAAAGIQYVFKSGESVPDRSKGFDLDEAAVALACSMGEVSYAVLAKRNIGLLVSNEKSGKYAEVFKDDLEGAALWEKVTALRQIDATLTALRSHESGRSAQLLVHGNRVLAHCVYRCQQFNKSASLRQITISAASVADSYVTEHFPDSYMAVLFKNTDKCGHIAKAILDSLKADFGLSATAKKPGGAKKAGAKKLKK